MSFRVKWKTIMTLGVPQGTRSSLMLFLGLLVKLCKLRILTIWKMVMKTMMRMTKKMKMKRMTRMRTMRKKKANQRRRQRANQSYRRRVGHKEALSNQQSASSSRTALVTRPSVLSWLMRYVPPSCPGACWLCCAR